MAERAVLIDGNAALWRAWFAVPPMTTRQGQPANAVYGLARMLRRLIRDTRPAFGAFVRDAGHSGRGRALPGYKASRPPRPPDLAAQDPLVEELLAAAALTSVRVEGFEADDVMASLCCRLREEEIEVCLVTPDKDLAELVGPGVRWFHPAEQAWLDEVAVRHKFGVPPKLMPDWLALTGDRVDEVPGLPGVGPRTAARWLADAGSLEALISRAPDRRLTEQAGALRARRDALSLRRDLEVPPARDLAWPPPDAQRWDAFALRHGLHRLLSPNARPADLPERGDWQVAATLHAGAAALAGWTGPVGLAWLVESDALVGLAVAFGPDRALFLDLRSEDWSPLAPWLADPLRPKVGHGHKALLGLLARRGLALRGVVGDTAVASHRLDPAEDLPHHLEQVARTWLGRGLPNPLRARQRWSDLPGDLAASWACLAATTVAALWPRLAAALEARSQVGEHQRVDLRVSAVLAQMEQDGVAVDAARLATMAERYRAERRRLEARLHQLAGRAFTPSSTRQLQEVLFSHLGLPAIGSTRTGARTDAEALAALNHPIREPLLRHRAVRQVLDGVLRPLQAAIQADGRVRPTWQETTSATGRLVSARPDLQRLPQRDADAAQVRAAIVAPPGKVLVCADYEQIELRLLAALSGDTRLVEAVRRGEDLHRTTAGALLGKPPADVQPEERTLGKMVNFATLYGQGPAALAAQIGRSEPEARRFIRSFFEGFPGVAAWKTDQEERARREGYVTTVTGRRRALPELRSHRAADRAYGQRVAINTPIQGSVVDLLKRALIRLTARLVRLRPTARLVLQAHDELVVEAAEGSLPEVQLALQEAMTGALALPVPLTVRVGWGATWSEAGGAPPPERADALTTIGLREA